MGMVDYEQRDCRTCGAQFRPLRSIQVFCSVPCRDAWHREQRAFIGRDEVFEIPGSVLMKYRRKG